MPHQRFGQTESRQVKN